MEFVPRRARTNIRKKEKFWKEKGKWVKRTSGRQRSGILGKICKNQNRTTKIGKDLEKTGNMPGKLGKIWKDLGIFQENWVRYEKKCKKQTEIKERNV